MREHKICAEPNCNNTLDKSAGRGLCGKCYFKHLHRGTLQQFSKHSPINRFEQCFNKIENNCWIWNKSTDTKNYGKFYFQGKLQTASRVAYTLYIGTIPDQMCVLHHCDQPLCVNPNHLFLGTQKDNIKDMINKGRKHQIRGSKIGSAKLTEDQVLTIYNQKHRSLNDLALEFNVHPTTISKIKKKQVWKHLFNI